MSKLLDAIADKLKTWMPESPLNQALLLTFIQSFTWYVFREMLHVVCASCVMILDGIPYYRFSMTPEGTFALLLFSSIIASIIIPWFICIKVFNRLYGRSSCIAYWITGPIGMIAVFIIATFTPFPTSLDLFPPPRFIPSLIPINFKGAQDSALYLCILHSMLSFPAIAVIIFIFKRISKTSNSSLRNTAIFLISSVLAIVPANRILAYNEFAHSTILTKEASELVDNYYAHSYGELMSRSSEIIKGGLDEDALIYLSFINHFYRPTDGFGLTTCAPFEDYIPVINCPFQSARARLNAEGFYSLAISEYKNGNKENAYKNLGHAIHLCTQDMYAPQHVFDDAHVVINTLIYKINKGGVDWWVEDCPNIKNDNRRLGKIPAELTKTASEILHESAEATYRAVRISGDLYEDPEEPASGEINEMFPVGYFQEIIYTDTGDILTDYWSIPDVGQCYRASGYIRFPDSTDEWWVADNFSGRDIS